MTTQPTLIRTQEAQEALDRVEDRGAVVFANMLFALVVRRAFGEGRIETAMEIDAHFLIRVFAEYFADRDAVYKALALGGGGGPRAAADTPASVAPGGFSPPPAAGGEE